MSDTDRNTVLEQNIKNIEHELEKLRVEAESQRQQNNILLDANDGLMKRIYALESEIAELKRQNGRGQAVAQQIQSEPAGQ